MEVIRDYGTPPAGNGHAWLPKAHPTGWGQVPCHSHVLRDICRERRLNWDAALRRTIEESRALLDLGDNWDDADSPAPAKQAWERATSFLTSHAAAAWRGMRVVVPVPDILPGPAGGIDLHWDTPSFELLIHVPEASASLASFYADNRGDLYIKGTFDPTTLNEALLDWLAKM